MIPFARPISKGGGKFPPPKSNLLGGLSPAKVSHLPEGFAFSRASGTHPGAFAFIYPPFLGVLVLVIGSPNGAIYMVEPPKRLQTLTLRNAVLRALTEIAPGALGFLFRLVGHYAGESAFIENTACMSFVSKHT